MFNTFPFTIINSFCLMNIIDAIRINNRYVYTCIKAEKKSQEENVDHSIRKDISH